MYIISPYRLYHTPPRDPRRAFRYIPLRGRLLPHRAPHRGRRRSHLRRRHPRRRNSERGHHHAVRDRRAHRDGREPWRQQLLSNVGRGAPRERNEADLGAEQREVRTRIQMRRMRRSTRADYWRLCEYEYSGDRRGMTLLCFSAK